MRIGALPIAHTRRRSLGCLLGSAAVAALLVLPGPRAAAQDVQADGRTATSIASAGNVTDVTTGTISGSYGVNSFSRLGVSSGATVNIHAPGGAAGTVNIVTGGRSVVNGTLNSMQNGRVGGEMYIANPDGFAVGANGRILGGRIGLSTPTRGYAEGLIGADGEVSAAHVGAIADGRDPQRAGGLDIQGRIAAGQSVRLRTGGDITLGGEIAAGARSGILGSAVNMGEIRVEAGGALRLSPGARVTGGGTTDGGRIDMRAGGDVMLDWDVVIGAEGLGAGSGGTVTLFAQGSAYLGAGAVVSAAALGAGDGGFVEFSAADKVALAGELRAWSAMGQGGAVLIDPAEIDIAADVFQFNADYTAIASEKITVEKGVTISTRQIAAGGDHLIDKSVGASANLTLEAPEIVLESGARLLAHATDGFKGGDVLLDAHMLDSVDLSFSALPEGRAQITVTEAILTGRDVTLRARVVKDNILSTSGMLTDYVTDTFGTTGIGFIDGFLATQVGNADARAASMLAALDAANLPAALTAEARTHISESYILADRDAVLTSRAETQVALAPTDASLAIALAHTTTIAETLAQDNQIETGRDLTVRATVHEDQTLNAGSDDAGAASNMALAISGRKSDARAIIAGSTYRTPEVDGIDKTDFLATARGQISVRAAAEKDVTITALSGANDSGAGEAVIVSVDDTNVDAVAAGFLRTDDGDLTIAAETLYQTYDLTARVDEDATGGGPAVAPTGSAALDGLAVTMAGAKTALAGALGGVLDGAAFVHDKAETDTLATFGGPYTYTNLVGSFDRTAQGALFRAAIGDALATDDTGLGVSALTDLGESTITAEVGSAGDEGKSRGGTAILSKQLRMTEALTHSDAVVGAPDIDVTATLSGTYRMTQSSVGQARFAASYGALLTDFTTRGRLDFHYGDAPGAITIRAEEALTLTNRQSAENTADSAAGTLGGARTDYESDVIAEVVNSNIQDGDDAGLDVIADSATSLETIAMRNGAAQETDLLGAAAVAITQSRGQVRASLGEDFGRNLIMRDRLAEEARDATSRQIVANASAEGDGTNLLGALAYDGYRRDTVINVDHSDLFIGADGMALAALSETGASVVSIGRASGSGGIGLAGLGAWLKDDRDVTARLVADAAAVELAGDLEISATREDGYTLLQGTEASSGTGAGLAAGLILLGGETRAEAVLDQLGAWYAEFDPEDFEVDPENVEVDPEVPHGEEEIGVSQSVGGDIAITATNAASAFALSMGGGSADDFGGMGPLAYIDMGQLAADDSIAGVTDALLDQGGDRVDYTAETDAVRSSVADDFAGAGDTAGVDLSPQDVRASSTVARLAVAGGNLEVGGAVTVETQDQRRATAVGGQLQNGLVVAAVDAFGNWFSIDEISENGVTLNLRPDSVGEAVGTAVDVYTTGVKAHAALGDFKDAISDGATISTGATTFGAAAGVTVIGGAVLAEIDLDPEGASGIAGGLSAGGVGVATVNAATAAALGFGFQLGSNSIGASVSHARLNQLGIARIIDGTIDAASVDVTTDMSGRATTIGGVALGASGQAAVGGSLTLTDMDAAALAEVVNTDVSTTGAQRIVATDDSSALALTLAGGISAGPAAVIGAVGATSQRSLTRAGAFDSSLTADGRITIRADQSATTNALVLQAGGGANVAAGVAIADVTLRGATEAAVGNSTLSAQGLGHDILVGATSERSIDAAAVGASVGGTAGVTGSISLVTREDLVRAQVDGSDLTAQDSIVVRSLADAVVGAAGGAGEGMLGQIGAENINLALGGTVGVGVSISSIRASGTVEALVTGDSTLLSNGLAAGNGVTTARRLAADGYATRADHTYHGVAVVADSETHLNALSASASVGGTVAVSVQVPVLILRDTVRAMIEGGSADAVTDVAVLAGNRPVLRLLSLIAQGSGTVAGGADIEVIELAGVSEAQSRDADLTAGGDIAVAAVSPQDISTWSASLSAGGQVAVGGVVQSLLATSQTLARVDGGSVTAEGRFDIGAHAPRQIEQTALNVSLSGLAGVGGTILKLLARDAVLAEVGDSTPSARTTLDVQGSMALVADSDLDMTSVVASGSGGIAAVSGSILVARSEQDVTARLGDYTDMVPGQADNLDITARQGLTASTTVGNIGGGGAAVGAAILALSGSSEVLAEIGAQADVDVSGRVDVAALAERDLTGLSAAIGGGGMVFQGSLTSLQFGEVDEIADEGRQGTNALSADQTLAVIDDDLAEGDALDYGAGDAATAAALSEATAVRQSIAATATPKDDAVTARVGLAAQIDAGDAIDVTATEAGVVNATSGGLALGPGALTAAFTRLRLGTRVEVDLATSARLYSPGAIALGASSDLDAAGPKALAGAGGALAGVGAISETHAARRVSVTLADNARLDNRGDPDGTIDIEARETGLIEAEADGASVGAVAAGAVFATTRNTSTVEIDMPDAQIHGGTIDIAAQRSGAIRATGFGLVAGVVSGAGVDVAAYDASFTRIDLGASTLDAGGTARVTAKGAATVEAVATGAAVSQLGALGASFALAERTAEVELSANALTLDAARADFTARDFDLSADPSLLAARVFSATGGALSLDASLARLRNESDVDLTLGFAALDVSGDVTATAGSNTVLDALSTGINLGFVALGANVVDVDSDADATLTFTGAGDVGGDLILQAEGIETADVQVTSGKGGIYAATASKSEVDLNSDVALMLDGDTGLIVAGELRADTLRAADLTSQATSIEASLAGYGGTWIDNDIDAGSTLTLAGQITAAEYAAEITTDIDKRDPDFSGLVGSVGVIDGTSLRSETEVDVTAVLTIADGATLTETGAAEWYDYDSLFAITGRYDLSDSVKIDTGGGILVPSARTSIELDADEVAIRVGDAEITGEAGMEFSILADADIDTEAFVNVYGLAGVPYAEAISDYDATQSIELAAGADLRSNKGSIRMNAGSGDSGGQVVDVSSELRVWNATALPIGRTPFAESRNTQDNLIDLAAGAELRAANDVVLVAGAGARDTYSYGLASDLYRETAETVINALGDIVGADDVSFDTEVGETTESATNAVTVDGEAESGTNYFQQLVANSTGIVTLTEGIDAELMDDADVRGALEAALATLEADLAGAYSDPVLTARLEAEIARLERIIDDLGTAPIDLLLVRDAYAAAGDIEVTADMLAGSGTLISHGDATIEIVNDGRAVIELVDATIPYRGGGLVTLNGLPLTGATAPAGLSVLESASADAAAEPVITVENRYNSSTGISGDIYVTGAVENLRGRVGLSTTTGDIMVLGGTIDAAEVDIDSGGDFFLSAAYDDALVNLAASPFATFAGIFEGPGGTCTFLSCTIDDLADPAWAGDIAETGQIIAEGGVYVYANGHVNINGLIQSGRTDYTVGIEDSIADVLDDLPASEAIALLYSPAGNGTSPAEDPLFPKASGNVALRYDQEVDAIVVDPILARGGEIEIVGQIVSTGGGVLSAAHGFAQVEIVNDSDIPVILSDISTGYDEGAVGRIRLIDLARPRASGDGFVETVFTMAPNGDVTRTTYGGGLGVIQLDSPTYEIEAPWRVVYAAGDISQRADGSYELADSPGLLFEYFDSFLESGVDFPGDGQGIVVTGQSVLAEDVIVTSSPYFDEYVITADDNDLMAVFDEFYGITFFEDQIRDNDYVGIESDLITAFDPVRTIYSDWTEAAAPNTFTRIKSYYYETSDYDLHVVAADKPIDVAFHGHETGRLDVTSVGDVIIGGSVWNRSGPTTITSTDGAIVQNSTTAPFETNKLTLDAGNGIGQAAVYGDGGFGRLVRKPITAGGVLDGGFGGLLQTPLADTVDDASLAAMRIDQAEGFGLSVTAGESAKVEEVTGDMQLLDSWAVGDLDLSAAGSILVHRNSLTGVVAAADRLRLRNTAGSIGTLSDPITFDASVLRAEAEGDINLLTGSDRPVKVRNLVSRAGDVSLVSTIASIRDFDFTQRVDRRAEDGLLEALWDQLGLRAVDADGAPETARAAEVVAAFEAQQTDAYFEYWNQRRRPGGPGGIGGGAAGPLGGTRPYDPDHDVTYSATERATLAASGRDEAAIAALEAEATARFHALHEDWGGRIFNENFSYDATLAERAALTEGLHWSDGELGRGLRRSVILEVTDTEPVVEDANLAGRNINIVSGGSIGRDRAPYVIARDEGLTAEALEELWTAERIDLTFSPDSIEIARRDDIDVEATGHLIAIAAEDVLIGSETPLAILNANAGGQLRVKSGEALTRAAPTALVPHMLTGTDFVLEAAEGGIGAQGEALLLDQKAGGALVARAEGDIRLTAPASDLAVSEIFSEGGVVLATLVGSILDVGTDEDDILTDNLVLLAGDAIGAPGNPLEAAMQGGAGSLSAVAVAGAVDLAVTGDVTAGLVGSVQGDARLDFAGDLALFGPGDPGLAALFDLGAFGSDTGDSDSGLTGLGNAVPGLGAAGPLGGPATIGAGDIAGFGLPFGGAGAGTGILAQRVTQSQGIVAGSVARVQDALAALDLTGDGGGLDQASSSAFPAVPALHAGGMLTLDVGGGVAGRDGLALDLRAHDGAVIHVGRKFGSRDNYIVSRIDSGLVSSDATLRLRDHDRDDAIAPHYYLANIGRLDLLAANLTEGESDLRLANLGDLTVAENANLRGGTLWLGAVGDNPEGSGAVLRIDTGANVEAGALGLLAPHRAEITGAGALGLGAADLAIIAGTLRIDEDCTGCGDITLAGGDLRIVTQFATELGAVDLGAGALDITTTGIGGIDAASIIAGDVTLATRLGDVDIGTLSAASLDIDASGSVLPGSYAVSGTMKIDALALGLSPKARLVLAPGKAGRSVDLFGTLGMYVSLLTGADNHIDRLATGRVGVGVDLWAEGAPSTLVSIGTIETGGTPVVLSAPALRLDGAVSSGGGDVTLEARSGMLDMHPSARVDAGDGAIEASAAGDMTIAQISSTGFDADAPMIRLDAGGRLTGLDGASATITAPSPGTALPLALVLIDAGSIANTGPAGLRVDAGLLDVSVSSGDIHLAAGLPATTVLALRNSGGGDIELVADGSVSFFETVLDAQATDQGATGTISILAGPGGVDGSISELVASDVTLLAPEGGIGRLDAPLHLVPTGAPTMRIGARDAVMLDVAGDLTADFVLSETEAVIVTAEGKTTIARLGGTGEIIVTAAEHDLAGIADGTVIETVPAIANLITPERYRPMTAGAQASVQVGAGEEGETGGEGSEGGDPGGGEDDGGGESGDPGAGEDGDDGETSGTDGEGEPGGDGNEGSDPGTGENGSGGESGDPGTGEGDDGESSGTGEDDETGGDGGDSGEPGTGQDGDDSETGQDDGLTSGRFLNGISGASGPGAAPGGLPGGFSRGGGLAEGQFVRLRWNTPEDEDEAP